MTEIVIDRRTFDSIYYTVNAAGRRMTPECEALHDSNGCCTHCMPGMFREPWSRWVRPREVARPWDDRFEVV